MLSRLKVVLATILLVFTGLVVVATPASAGTDDYPSQWRNVAQDSVVDSWGQYNRECTSFVAWRLSSRNSFTIPRAYGYAYQWGGRAANEGYAVNMTPAVGAVAWWNSNAGMGSYGHVAWVESVNSNGTVTIEQYNIPGGSGAYSEATISASSVSGYIHFKDITTSPSAAVITNKFYLNNNFDSTHDILTTYGDPGVGALAGDWNGDGVRTLAVRYGNVYYMNNGFDGAADFTVAYGDPGVEVFAGDWDGNGTETLGVRYGNTFYLDNGFDGVADIVTSYGSPTDEVVVGDWNGDGIDTLGVRVGNTFYLNNNFDSTHDILTTYGDSDDHVLVGDWNGDGIDTLGIREVDVS